MWTCLLYVEYRRIASTVEGVGCKYHRHLDDGWEHWPPNVKAFCCSQLSKVLPGMLFSRLTPYVEKINSNHHCGFCHNRWSCTDDVLCISHICWGGGGGRQNTAWWGTTAAVHIQSKLVCIWEVSGLIGGSPVALIESPRRYWVSNSNDAMTAFFNIFSSSLWF